MITRHYAYVGSRRVHYRRAGSGPPIVLVHESPQSSFVLEPLMRRLAVAFTVIAPDTPGAGESEPLSTERPAIGDYAVALGETLTTLGIKCAPIYGTHTGAKIALEFALRYPDRVSALVMQGLGIYTETEQRNLLDNYIVSLEPEFDGSHLNRAWTIRRDMLCFWPWFNRTEAGRLALDLPLDDDLHDLVFDFLRTGALWGKTYRAAFSYDPRPALAALNVPGLFLGVSGDPIADLITRVAPGRVSVKRIPWTNDAIAQEVLTFVPSRGDSLPAAETSAPQETEIRRDYVKTAIGEVLMRHVGVSLAERPIVLLQASPYSSAVLEPLMSALSVATGGRRVIAFDTPGNGDSTPWPRVRSIFDLADAFTYILDVAHLREIDLYGTHTGALVAMELALRSPARVKHLVLDGISAFPKDMARDLVEHYAPAMQVRTDGSHLTWAWSALRDQSLFFPHHRRTAGNVKRGYPMPAPAVLHRNFMEFMKGGRTYHWNYRAAFAYETLDRYALLNVPTLLTATPADPLRSHLDLAKAVRPDIEARERSASYDVAAQDFATFLAR